MTEIHITALIAALLLVGEHYFPWGMLLHHKLPRLAAYVLGVLALIGPLSALYAFWIRFQPEIGGRFYLGALWAVVGAGGAAVLICYALDHVLERMALAHELAELIQLRDRHDARADQ